jgi:hypothetical protein
LAGSHTREPAPAIPAGHGRLLARLERHRAVELRIGPEQLRLRDACALREGAEGVAEPDCDTHRGLSAGRVLGECRGRLGRSCATRGGRSMRARAAATLADAIVRASSQLSPSAALAARGFYRANAECARSSSSSHTARAATTALCARALRPISSRRPEGSKGGTCDGRAADIRLQEGRSEGIALTIAEALGEASLEAVVLAPARRRSSAARCTPTAGRCVSIGS